jgi:hypothetical protein
MLTAAPMKGARVLAKVATSSAGIFIEESM